MWPSSNAAYGSSNVGYGRNCGKEICYPVYSQPILPRYYYPQFQTPSLTDWVMRGAKSEPISRNAHTPSHSAQEHARRQQQRINRQRQQEARSQKAVAAQRSVDAKRAKDSAAKKAASDKLSAQKKAEATKLAEMNKDITKALVGGLSEDNIIRNINNNKPGFNINTVNPKTGETTLQSALLLGKPKVVLCLLNKNVSLRMNILTKNQTTVYLKKSPISGADKTAIINKFDEVLKSNIHQAISGNLLGTPHIMDRVDSNTHDFNINTPGEQGQTPVQAALYYGRPGVVKALLARNADISIRDAQGRDTMWYAQNTIDQKIKNDLVHMVQMQIDSMNKDITKALVGGLSEDNIIRNINNNKPGFNINTINLTTGVKDWI